MKKNLLIPFLFAFILKSTIGLGAQHTISFSGFVFSPDNITVNIGDTINFSLSSIHSAIEVDQSTWNADGNTSNGGFQVPAGGGSIIVTQAKTYYYVCGFHYFMGMKGRIVVNDVTGVSQISTGIKNLEITPNPSFGLVTIKSNVSSSIISSLKISDFTGKKILEKANVSSVEKFDLSGLKAGIYFVELNSLNNVTVKRLIISK